MCSCICVQGKRSSSESLITCRSNLLIWQCTPSKPGWHLQMYSLKTSPRLVGAMISHEPSFLQGLGLQGPEGRRKKRDYSECMIYLDNPSKKAPLCCTRLCEVAGVSTEAIRTDTDEWILSYPCHTCSSIMAKIHLTVVT